MKNTRSSGDGLEAGDAVTAAQMRALYGAGMHPVATQRPEQLRDTDMTAANIEAATRLEGAVQDLRQLTCPVSS